MNHQPLKNKSKSISTIIPRALGCAAVKTSWKPSATQNSLRSGGCTSRTRKGPNYYGMGLSGKSSANGEKKCSNSMYGCTVNVSSSRSWRLWLQLKKSIGRLPTSAIMSGPGEESALYYPQCSLLRPKKWGEKLCMTDTISTWGRVWLGKGKWYEGWSKKMQSK